MENCINWERVGLVLKLQCTYEDFFAQMSECVLYEIHCSVSVFF